MCVLPQQKIERKKGNELRDGKKEMNKEMECVKKSVINSEIGKIQCMCVCIYIYIYIYVYIYIYIYHIYISYI